MKSYRVYYVFAPEYRKVYSDVFIDCDKRKAVILLKKRNGKKRKVQILRIEALK